MPPGVPVATVGVDNPKNAAVLAARILGARDRALHPPRDGCGVVGEAQARGVASGGAGGGRRAGGAGRGAGGGRGRDSRARLVHRRGGQGARAGHGPRRGGVRGRGGRVGRRGGPLGPPRAHLVGRAGHGARAPALPGRDDPGGRRCRLQAGADPARPRARGHAVRGAHPRRARRAHHVRREARRLRLRGAPQPDPAASGRPRRSRSVRCPARSAPTRRTAPRWRRRC